MITVSILADSINPAGKRITSWLIKYPRFIHSEFMTHRVFSRNAASSRAIPLAKMIEAIKEEPALPEFWAAEHKGMQALEALEDEDLKVAKFHWDFAKDKALDSAKVLSNYGLAKSLCNRLIEPFSHITVLATATDHSNFFALRAHPAAMPEFQVLAYRMLDQYLKSAPRSKDWGEWHIPVFDNAQHSHVGETEEVLKVATARCARLSYLTFDGEFSIAKDIELHDRLLTSGHMSPFEHCAQAVDCDPEEPEDLFDYKPSNFDVGEVFGWQQYRKQFENENRTNVDLAATLATKPDWIKL